MPAAAAIVVATAVTALVQANQQKKAAEKANQIATDQAAAVKDQQDKIMARQDNQESTATANAARDQAKQRQGQLAAGATGARSTILTSPVGVATPSIVATKTLLGQ